MVCGMREDSPKPGYGLGTASRPAFKRPDRRPSMTLFDQLNALSLSDEGGGGKARGRRGSMAGSPPLLARRRRNAAKVLNIKAPLQLPPLRLDFLSPMVATPTEPVHVGRHATATRRLSDMSPLPSFGGSGGIFGGCRGSQSPFPATRTRSGLCSEGDSVLPPPVPW